MVVVQPRPRFPHPGKERCPAASCSDAAQRGVLGRCVSLLRGTLARVPCCRAEDTRLAEALEFTGNKAPF